MLRTILIVINIIGSLIAAFYLGLMACKDLGITINCSGKSDKAKIAKLKNDLQRERIQNFILENELKGTVKTERTEESPFADGQIINSVDD